MFFMLYSFLKQRLIKRKTHSEAYVPRQLALFHGISVSTPNVSRPMQVRTSSHCAFIVFIGWCFGAERIINHLV
jgi:hypothetical protein